MNRSSLRLASHVATGARKPRFEEFSLSYFLTRAKVFSLYRSLLRSSRAFGDSNTRWDTIQWLRHDFESNRSAKPDQVKNLLSQGQRQLKQLSSTNVLVGTEGMSKLRGKRKL